MITKNIKDFIIGPNVTLKDAMTKISDNYKGIIFVVQNKKLIGVLSDGDIRRALIRGASLLTHVEKIMNVNYIFSVNKDEKKLTKLSKERKTIAIPLVDKNDHLIGIFFRN